MSNIPSLPLGMDNRAETPEQQLAALLTSGESFAVTIANDHGIYKVSRAALIDGSSGPLRYGTGQSFEAAWTACEASTNEDLT